MGASVKGWILPGSTTSSFMAPRLGWITETVGTERSRVSRLTLAAVLTRAPIPQVTTAPAISNRTMNGSTTRLPCGICLPPPLVQETEHRGHEEESGHRGEHQTSNDGPSQRGVLLSAFPKPQGHRD